MRVLSPIRKRRARIVNQRLVVSPMEPRAVVAAYDEEKRRFELHAGSQGAQGDNGHKPQRLKAKIVSVAILTCRFDADALHGLAEEVAHVVG